MYSYHPLVDLTRLMGPAEKAPVYLVPAVTAVWIRTDNADTFGHTVGVVLTGYSFSKQRAAVRTEVVIRANVIPAMIAGVRISIVRFLHGVSK
jgi:hypothetical protein